MASALVLGVILAGPASAQTQPPAQPLPYAYDFRSLASTSSTYPAGWQGWVNGAPGGAYLTTGPTANVALTALSTASTSTGGVHNYNGKIGPLDNATNDYGLVLAVDATGATGVVARYEVMTIRNPYDGVGNTRINEISLQYRVGTAGAWTTLAGTAYQNNTTLQTGSTIVTPQKLEYRSLTLPPACDNQPVVQLRWAQREVGGSGLRPSFAIDNVSVQQPPAGAAATALQFDGVNDYVTFGQALGLGATTFTVETWFRRTGAGVSTTTGTGGISTIVPLVAKGFAETDGGTADLNYILGINTVGNVLAADYEEGSGQLSPGVNHPLSGITPIALNTWYHAAATFDGTTLRLYLNGVLENVLVVGPGRLPQFASTQHATLATALNTTGGIGAQPLGLFQGQLDEARIWSVARSACDLTAGMNLELAMGSGLLGRWGLNDGAASLAGNSLATPNGLLMNGPTWVGGSPFNAPVPTLATPTDLVAVAPDEVQVSLTWTDHESAETAYEVERSSAGPGGPFSLIATLPADASAHVDTPLAAGTEYCYRVRAVGTCLVSAYADVACATTTAVYTLTYDAGPHGTIAGAATQVVLAGASGSEVTAVADPGYHFVDWSDGVLTAERTETNVLANVSVTANFAVDVPANAVDVAAAAGLITQANPIRTLPVTISRTSATPILAFSVRISVSPELAVSGGSAGIHEGPYLATANPATSFFVVDLGVDGLGNHAYRVDAATLGLPCGASAASGTLFTLDVAGTVPGGSGTVTITNLALRDCVNASLVATIGTAASVGIDQTAPIVAVTVPNGGETWPIGTIQTIEWNGSDPEGVAGYDLAYSTDGGLTYPHAIATVPGTQDTYVWTVPNTPSLLARVRVTAHDVNGNSADDASDANFALSEDRVAAVPGPGATISDATPCLTVPVVFTRTDDTPIRGYSVTLELSPNLTLCGTSFVSAGHLLEPRSFQVTPRPGNRWTIDEVTLGLPCGVTGTATLFELSVGSSDVSGTGTITMISALARDCVNGPVPIDLGPPASVPIEPRTTGVPGEVLRTRLAPARPTPFAASTTLEFELAQPGNAELAVFAVNGRRLRTLVRGPQPAGTRRLTWDGTDEQGHRPEAGVYFARLVTDAGRFSRVLVLLER